MKIEHLDVKPVLTSEQLGLLKFQPLTPAHGKAITRSAHITCEGKVKALFLKGAGADAPIKDISCKAALKALQLMRFNPADNSRRGSVKKTSSGGDLVLGWMNVARMPWEDIFRAGHRDHFPVAMWLVPLLKDFEQALQQHLPDYWQFHLEQAKRLVRPPDEKLLTIDSVRSRYEREMLKQWDHTRYYHFPGTEAFSTLTLNHNLVFLAHHDGNNVPGTLGCLAAVGSYAGGALCFPRLGVSFDLRPGDLLIADTNEEYHGMVGEPFGNRYSVVAYLHSSLLPRK
jgi:hypothetical protein